MNNLQLHDLDITEHTEIPNNINTLKLINSGFSSTNHTFIINKLKNIRNLEIMIYNFNSELYNLPTVLRTLHINSYIFNQHLDLLPESIRELYLNSNAFNKKLDDLPSGLNKLVIDKTIKINDLDYIINVKNKTYADITGAIRMNKHGIDSKIIFNQPLQNLPSSLKHLEIVNNIFNEVINISNLNYLNTLILDVKEIKNKDILSNIPRNLSTIHIKSLVIIDFPNFINLENMFRLNIKIKADRLVINY